jgi:catechol-2,3-dioxygenase
MLEIKRLNAVNLMVRDLPESLDWYKKHFGFEHKYDVEGGVVIAIGDTELVLSPTPDPKLPLAEPDTSLCIHTIAFEVDKETLENAKSLFEGITVISQAEFVSVIINDPNGYCIELYVDL